MTIRYDTGVSLQPFEIYSRRVKTLSLWNILGVVLLRGKIVVTNIRDDIDDSKDPYDMGMNLPEGALTREDEDLLRKHAEGKDLAINLGTYKGRSAMLLSHFVKQVITIDKIDNTQGLFDKVDNVEMIIKNTHGAVSFLEDGKANLLFIDAGHSYQNVIDDYNLYTPKLRDDGIIIFHDYKYMTGEVKGKDVKLAVDFLMYNEPLTQREVMGWSLAAKRTRLSIVRKNHKISFFDMTLKDLVNKVLFANGRCLRSDIIVRYIGVEHYVKTGEVAPLYEKLQKRRMATLARGRDVTYNPNRLTRLVDSFKEIGFNRGTPIIIGLNEQIIEGAHRLACCMYFNIDPVPIERWMDQNGSQEHCAWLRENFDEEELVAINKKKEELYGQFRIS